VTKRYDEEEVRLILKKALDPALEENPFHAGDRGLTLAELQDIAAEVGIDPRRIQLAASEVGPALQASRNPYVGLPTTIQFESALRGVKLPESLEHEVVSLIRSVLGRQGVISRDGDAFEWKARDAMGGRYVSITPTHEGIRLRVLGNYRDGLMSILGGVGGVTFVGTSAILSSLALGPAGILLGAAAVAVLPPRFAYRAWRKREDVVMAELHRKVFELLSRSSGPERISSPGDPDPVEG